MKTGIGFDIHVLADGRPLVLGGITVPFPRGLLGHSDGDVVLHALADATLGALGKPDIGICFPDDDPGTRGMDSSVIVEKAVGIMKDEGYRVGNADIIIMCEEPRLSSYYEEIRTNIAGLLEIPPQNVGCKARTFEGIGAIGAGEAIASMASVTLKPAGHPDGEET